MCLHFSVSVTGDGVCLHFSVSVTAAGVCLHFSVSVTAAGVCLHFRHARTNHKNRINGQSLFIIVYRSVCCLKRGFTWKNLRMFCVVLLKAAFFLILCVFGSCQSCFSFSLYCCRTMHVWSYNVNFHICSLLAELSARATTRDWTHRS